MFRRVERPKFGINHLSYKKTRNERSILSNKFKNINICCEIYMFCLEKFFISKFFCIFWGFNFDNSRQNIARFWTDIFIYGNLNKYSLRIWYIIYLSNFANHTIFALCPSNRSTRSSTFCDFPINKRALFISLWVVRILLYSTQHQSKKERIKNRIIHHNFWYLFFRKKERKNPSRRIQRKRHQNIGLKYTQKIPPKKENIDSVRIIFAKVW